MEPGGMDQGQDHFIRGLDPIFFRWLLLPGPVTLGWAASSSALAAFALKRAPGFCAAWSPALPTAKLH